jgi:hypothetical protein
VALLILRRMKCTTAGGQRDAQMRRDRVGR